MIKFKLNFSTQNCLQSTQIRTDLNVPIVISIVIPMYNQSAYIVSSLSGLKRVLDSIGRSYEVIVVNDGSTDNTLDILQKESSQTANLKVLSYTPNKGKGHAVKTGILASKGQLVLFTDGDLDISPEIINDYFIELESYDLVIASKRHPRSVVKSTLSRRFLSRVFNLIARLLTGIKASDTQAGLKAGNGKVLKKVFEMIVVKRYAFDVELLAVASIMNLRIKELPVNIEISKRFKIKDIARMFIDILAISYRYRISHWYQKRIKSSDNG